MVVIFILPLYVHMQYKLSREELNGTTLWLSMWDWDRMGRNKFLGEVRLPLLARGRDLSKSDVQKYKLQASSSNSWLCCKYMQ